MTTNDAAAARRSRSPIATAALIALLGAGLSACSSGGSVLSSSDAPGGAPHTSVLQPPPPPAAAKPQKRVALAPVIGAPETVAKQLSSQLSDAMGKQQVAVAQTGDKADYTVRGYIVAAKEKTGTKVSYIWDLTDGTGKRINRVTGEEVVAGSQNAKDPWTAVTPQLMQTIADRAASQIAGSIPAEQAVAQANTPPPSGTGLPVQNASAPATSPPAMPAATPPPARQQVASAPVASMPGEMRAMMPMVNGAPGDGGQSLPTALQRELSKSGVTISDRPAPNAYRIEGRVALGDDRDGRQPIQIDWTVKDGQGNRIGTVSQKNEIESGSLNGSWGQTADMAAAAAAQGIVKLMQPAPKTATN